MNLEWYREGIWLQQNSRMVSIQDLIISHLAPSPNTTALGVSFIMSFELE